MRNWLVAVTVCGATVAAVGTVAGPVVTAETKQLESGVSVVAAAGGSKALAVLIDSASPAERLAQGFKWAEGPVWMPEEKAGREGAVYFSDVPGNILWRWDRTGGGKAFLDPSGIAATPELREPGTNGLIPGMVARTLLAADHGNRAIVSINLTTRAKTILADRYNGKRFSSPNDLVLSAQGDIYFTDPPYGFAKGDESPLKEQPVNGVYRRSKDGGITLIEGTLSRPNGIILSPDGRHMYVANSDPKRAIIMRYPRNTDGTIGKGMVFADVTADVRKENPGLPDGMAIDMKGYLFATGPGGVLIFSPAGKRLGTIRVGRPVANVTFGGPEGDMLFLTAQDRLLSIRTKAKGYQPRP